MSANGHRVRCCGARECRLAGQLRKRLACAQSVEDDPNPDIGGIANAGRRLFSLQPGVGAPNEKEAADIVYGLGIARHIAAKDIGQTVVVADCACVAVEAMEGTDETIARAARIAGDGRYSGSGEPK